MAKQTIIVEAASLQEARKKVKSRAPKGLHIISEEVLSDGKTRKITGIADTIEAAFKKAQSELPSDAEVVEKQQQIAPVRKVVAVEAFDEKTARQQVKRDMAKTARIEGITLKKPGKKGLLGIGKKPNCYEVQVFEQAAVEIKYKKKAKIRVEIGERRMLSKQIRTIAATGDPYVDSCFTFDFQELEETRNWYEIKELRKVTELGDQGKVRKAMSLLESISGQYTDFDFVYIWKAILLDKMGKIDDARAVIREGLTKCNQKYSLCDKLARIEFNSGNLTEAVLWWIKSAAVQMSIGHADAFAPFLYLAYIAEALGDDVSSYKLLSEVDRIRYGQIRLDATGQNKVFSKVHREGNRSMLRAIQLLCKNYLP